MKIEAIPGARRRTAAGWERIDTVLVDDRPIKGEIIHRGRRKHTDEIITRFGHEERKGSKAGWLLARNGIVAEVPEVVEI